MNIVRREKMSSAPGPARQLNLESLGRTTRTDSIRHRLQADFRLSIVTPFGLATIAALLGFAVYRFSAGHHWIGLADIGIAAMLALGVVWAWRGHARAAAIYTSIIATSGCLAVIFLFAQDPSWVFVVIIANFLLVDRRLATTNSLVLVGVVLALPGQFDSGMGMATFGCVALLIGLFGLMFSQRTAGQQKRLSEMACRDALTGAGNRFAMERDLAAVEAAIRSGGADCALAVFDLDHFKKVNDRFGHRAGDRVLQEFVRIVNSATRERDRLYRFGGEEFVLLLPRTRRAGLEAVLGKLQARLHEELASPAGPETVSMGAAVFEPGEDWRQCLARADAALFAAKRAGRDCFCLAGEHPADAAGNPAGHRVAAA